MRQAIKGIPPLVEHDPIVRLPILEMDIPRVWIGQRGMLKFMDSLSDLKLEEDEEKSGNTERIPEENDTEKKEEKQREKEKEIGNRKM
jgi:hypothetical protein